MADQQDDYSYLETFDEDWMKRSGNLELSERETARAVVLPDLDYDSQLIAIRALLKNHRNAEAEHAAEIKKAEQLTRISVRNRHQKDPSIVALEEDFRQQNWIDKMYGLVYHDAAHSMAAVGLIAPFVESIFYQAFQGISKMMDGLSLPNDHERWHRPTEDQWNCHYVWKNGRRRTSLVEGILQLVDAIDMKAQMPGDLRLMLSALFEYRNKMFHCGFEWPLEERQRFDSQLSRWPRDWFLKATSGDDPWVFYMSPTFVEHCLDRTEDIITGIGKFCKERFQ